jgi:hypothetical protein
MILKTKERLGLCTICVVLRGSSGSVSPERVADVISSALGILQKLIMRRYELQMRWSSES